MVEMDCQSNLDMDDDPRNVGGQLCDEEVALNPINNNRHSKNSPALDTRNELASFDSEVCGWP